MPKLLPSRNCTHMSPTLVNKLTRTPAWMVKTRDDDVLTGTTDFSWGNYSEERNGLAIITQKTSDKAGKRT